MKTTSPVTKLEKKHKGIGKKAALVAIETFKPPSSTSEEYLTVLEHHHETLGHPKDVIEFKRMISRALGFKKHPCVIPFSKMGLPSSLQNLSDNEPKAFSSSAAYNGCKELMGTCITGGIDLSKTLQPSNVDRALSFVDLFPKMGIQAAESVILKWSQSTGLDVETLKSKITHVITTNTVNWVIPGLSHMIVDALKLPSTTSKLDANFMGCHGGGTILRHGFDIVNAGSNDEQRVALVISCETFSCLVDYNCVELNDLVIQSLFRDGCGAAIIAPYDLVGGGDKSRICYRSIESGIATIPGTSGLLGGMSVDCSEMAQSVKKTSPLWVVNLKIPEILKNFFTHPDSDGTKLLNRISSEYDVQTLDIAMHGGGIKIINNMKEVLESLNFPPSVLDDSFNAFVENGNNSSASIFYATQNVLNRQEEQETPRKILTLCFGPGVTVEWSILEPVFTRVSRGRKRKYMQ